jgi:Uma2 family endonuclease
LIEQGKALRAKMMMRLPPLESGDRLTRLQFEQRYQAMPDNPRKAELIGGIVYISSPVRYESHGQPHAMVMAWLGAYWAATRGVGLADNATVRLDSKNEPQPDALLRLEDGQSWIGDDGYVEGAPELILEVAASSASYDLHDKLNTYQSNGVQEYLVWQTYDNELKWFRLKEGKYQRLLPDDDGIIRSQIFPGLHLAVNALLARDKMSVMATVQKGLATPEHLAFVTR